MQQKPIYFKTDFKVFVKTEAGFAVPFRFELYTNSPSRPFVARYDGKTYHNCQLLEDGRLLIALDQHGMGLGKLMVKQFYYLNDKDYSDGVCDRVIDPRPVIDLSNKNNPCEIILSLQGDDQIEFTTELPPYYQQGLTPEEHEALINETNAAHEAAALANEQAGVAKEAAGLARTEAEEAHEAAGTAQSWADTAQKAATKANTGAKAAEEAAKNVGDAAEHADSAAKAAEELTETVRNEWDVIKKDAWNSVEALNTVGLEAKNTFEGMAEEYSQNEDARGQQFANNETYREQAFSQMQRGMTNDYAANEQERERKSKAATDAANSAAQLADTATTNANTAATKAANVNAVLNGDNLTVTDRNGQSVTRNVRGPKGDSVTMFPAVTIFGQPRIQETQMSEFSSQNYAQFPFLVDFAGRTWQLDCSITTGADVSQQHNVFDSAFGLAFAFSGGKFVLAMSSNGTSWNLGATSGTHSILANTTYYIRITWDGANYVLAYSTDKVNWTNDITVASAESLASKQIIIGKSLDNAHIFNGSINFAEARLTIAGVIVWEGMEEVGTATRMAIDMSNIDEAGKQKVNDIIGMGAIGKAISPYAKNIPLPLTHNLATGQILAMEGDMVVLKAQPGWGITRIDREEFGALGLASGDTLLLPMAHFDAEGKPTDNLMLVGAVLFAAEEAVKGQSGEVLYTRRTSLFRATDNAIATWGGVKKWLAIADNESLLICHPLDITSATITRNGNDAANAAADLNQRRRIEEKLNLGGKDPRAWVGMADQLAPSEKTEQAAYRDEVLPAGRILGFAPELGPSGAGTRDGQIADAVSPVMREVSGVSGGSGQMVDNTKNASPYNDASTVEKVADGWYKVTYKETSTARDKGIRFISNESRVVGHKYLAAVVLRSVTTEAPISIKVSSAWTGRDYTAISMEKSCVILEPTVTSGTFNVFSVDNTTQVGGYEVSNISLLDLTTLPQLRTTLDVASLGEDDAHRVAHALGFLALQRD